MTEFITGLALGGLAVFFILEYNRVKGRFFTGRAENGGNIQWQNMMNYDGSERGQEAIED